MSSPTAALSKTVAFTAAVAVNQGDKGTSTPPVSRTSTALSSPIEIAARPGGMSHTQFNCFHCSRYQIERYWNQKGWIIVNKDTGSYRKKLV